MIDKNSSNSKSNGSEEWREETYRLEALAGGLAAPRDVVERLARGESGQLYEAAKFALQHAFRRSAGEDAIGTWGPRYAAYCASVQANLFEDVPFNELRKAFDDGKGKELYGDDRCPPKMAAIYSSSALVVNTFGPWYADPSQLVINGQSGFKKIAFEAQLSHGLGGTPPHLDLCLDSDGEVLAVESKCLEYLMTKPARFKPVYDTIDDERATSPWYRHIAILRKDSEHYRYLDAAQLIKHYLGLAHSRPGQSNTLLYLFWEPVNWQKFETFRRHRQEIDAFSKVLAGDPVRFQAMSYSDLWKEWEQRGAPAWLRGHVERLKARYCVEL